MKNTQIVSHNIEQPYRQDFGSANMLGVLCALHACQSVNKVGCSMTIQGMHLDVVYQAVTKQLPKITAHVAKMCKPII